MVEITMTAITVRYHCLITGWGSSYFPHHCFCTVSANVTQLKIVLTWQHPQRGFWNIFWKPLDKTNVCIKPLHTLDTLASHLPGKPSPFPCVCANAHMSITRIFDLPWLSCFPIISAYSIPICLLRPNIFFLADGTLIDFSWLEAIS